MKVPGLDHIYNLLFESIDEGLIVADTDGNIILSNPRGTEMFGFEKNGLIGMKVEELIPTHLRKDHIKHRNSYEKAPTRRRMGMNLNLEAQKKDGSKFFVEISLNHINTDGQNYSVALITDITLRVKQEEKIKELNSGLEAKVKERTKEVLEGHKLYSAIATNFPNGTINVFDRELKYIFVEGLELKELGLSTKNLIGTSYLDKISQEIRPTIEKQLVEVFKGKAKNFELVHLEQTYRINAVPLSEDSDGIDKILVIEENITQQKLIEKQQEEALQKERNLNEMKSRFVSMASHEFRTPLSTVLSSVSLIEKYIDKGLIDKTEKHTKRIKGAIAGLTEILNDFLSVDKLENQVNSVSISTFNYEEFAKEIIEEMITIRKEGQDFDLILDGDNWLIQSDLKILRNILYNLFSNAIKYSGQNDKIIFESKIESGTLKIRITDNGIGIPQEEQKELFNRFFRAKNVTNIKGTGLGLNIVKKYVESLNGSIDFRSKLNKGTTFNISIPI